MPPPTRRMPGLRLLVVLLALSGCTAPATLTPALPPSPVASEALGSGVIVARRPPPPATPARHSVLAALGAAPDAAGGEVEFIVLADDGRPISVMQSDAGGLRTGDRVALIPGPRLRIAPAGVRSAAQ